MIEDQRFGRRQFRPGKEAGMRERVNQYQIPGAHEHGDDAAIGEIAGTENASGLRPLECGEPLFELTIERMITGHKARCPGASAISLDRGEGGLLDGWMAGKVQIIIAGEGEQAAAGSPHKWRGFAGTLGEGAPQMLAFKLNQFPAGEIVQGLHGFDRASTGHEERLLRKSIECYYAGAESGTSQKERTMRQRVSLLLAMAYLCAAQGQALAQAPPPTTVVNRGGGVAGTGIGFGAGGAGENLTHVVGVGHVGAGTGGISGGVGNVVGGTIGQTRAGSGGILDGGSWGSTLGGINGIGRGLGAGTGGIRDQIELGLDTGGITGSGIGSGVGGIVDLNSLGGGTGGLREQTAPRYRIQ